MNLSAKLFFPLLFIFMSESFGMSAVFAATPNKVPDSFYLLCKGIAPYWLESWSMPVQGMDSKDATLTLKLDLKQKTAQVNLINLGSLRFDLEAEPEFYFGSAQVNM